MHNRIRQILLAMPGTDRHENDSSRAAKNKDAFGWMTTLFQLRRFRLD